MTIARKRQVHPETTPYYHVICRCVRRAFLCGLDRHSGKDYAHRRQWIVERLKLLTGVFAIDIAAYAVMSNHLHLVVRLDPKRTKGWSTEEVIQRWSKIYGVPSLISQASKSHAPAAVTSAARSMIEIRRQRLSSLSWFMKCLNERIARKANQEDQCTGSFWEGRFKSQALLDEKALLSCMVYVDLNPIRAAIATTPERSDFTSVQQRIAQPKALPVPLMAFANESGSQDDVLPMDLPDYLALVDWTGRAVVQGKPGHIPEGSPPILNRMGLDGTTWIASMRLFKNAELRALGPLQALRDLASSLSRHWFRGASDCHAVFGPG